MQRQVVPAVTVTFGQLISVNRAGLCNDDYGDRPATIRMTG